MQIFTIGLCCKNKDKIILVNKNHITRSTEMDKIVTLYVDVVMPFSLHVKQVCSGVADSEHFFFVDPDTNLKNKKTIFS